VEWEEVWAASKADKVVSKEDKVDFKVTKVDSEVQVDTTVVTMEEEWEADPLDLLEADKVAAGRRAEVYAICIP